MVLSDLPEQHPYFFAGAPEPEKTTGDMLSADELSRMSQKELWAAAALESERK